MASAGRQLLVMRHAKSAWPEGVADLDRPLNRRGEQASATIGSFLLVNDLLPDHVVASPARRARDTAELVLQAAGQRPSVRVERELYEGDVMRVVRELPPDARRALLVGHQPDMGELLHALCGVDAHIPTGLLALLELEGPWSVQPAGRSVLQLLVGPRMLGAAPWTTVSNRT